MAHPNLAELENAVKSAREHQDLKAEVSALRQLGSLYQRNRQFTKAASCLLKAITIVEKTGNDQDLAVVEAHLGCVYWEMAQLKKAMTCFQKALKVQKQNQSASGQMGLLTLLGISHWRKCQWEEGLSFFKEALSLRKTQDLKAGKPSEAEEEFSVLSEALERGVTTLQNRIRLGREQNDPLKILQPIFSMIPLYLFTGRRKGVDSLLKEAGTLAEQLQKKDVLDAIPRLRELSENY
ncbi:MAG: hypothetical protein NPINA01_19850 [Nitrospinaceae bacterium]|nr:MAG: hypothetical protein NPINA01_19850 [Nitrospinaceae bacterium]